MLGVMFKIAKINARKDVDVSVVDGFEVTSDGIYGEAVVDEAVRRGFVRIDVFTGSL